jgi:hypothetical protein
MLFGRLRFPFERLAAEPRESARSARRATTTSAGPRGDSPRRDETYPGLERLDSEELDE